MNRQDSSRDTDQSCLSSSYLRLLDSDNSYNFIHAKCGIAIIINNINFSPESEAPVRKRAENDHKRLETVFRKMNFKVDICLDLTAEDMVDKMREVACNINYDHTDADCFACAIMSHGADVVDKNGDAHDVLLGVDGKLVYTRDLVSPFRDETCPYLHGKPKLFFIEACHGGEIEENQKVANQDVGEGQGQGQGQSSPKECLTRRKSEGSLSRVRKIHMNNENSEDPIVSPTPLFKDFMVMYATPPGYSLMRGKNGSYFIESLVEVFHNSDLKRLPLVRLLSRACQKMSSSFEAEAEEGTLLENPIPCVMSMLTKDLYFRR